MDVRLHWAGKLSKTCEESRGGPRAYVSVITWGYPAAPLERSAERGPAPVAGLQ